MKRFTHSTLTVIAVLLMCSMPAQADHYHHGGGDEWLWGLGLGLGIAAVLAPYAQPYAYPPPVVQQPAPQIYVQPAPRQPVEPNYWYFCPEPQGYYPYVKQCPSGWLKVVPSPSPPPPP